MRIGIDARELLTKPTGAGRYLLNLCTEWSNFNSSHQFILYSSDKLNNGSCIARLCHKDGTSPFEHRLVEGSSGTRWEQFLLPAVANQDRLDVFFSPAYSAPLAIRVPLILAIHDLSFAIHPEWFHWKEGLRRRWLLKRSADRATIVVTISEFSRREIVDYLSLPPKRVRVIQPGIRTSSKPRNMSSNTDPLIIFVGSIFNRRHVPDLIQAFARVLRLEPKASLAIVGENRSYPKEDLHAAAELAGVSDRVSILSYVTEETLSNIYSRAKVFAFLSEYEGFGMTPLEAMASHVPVVVTDTEVAREIYADAATFVPGGNLDAIASAILMLLRDSQARQSACERASRVLQKYSWKRAAKDMLAVFEIAAGHNQS